MVLQDRFGLGSPLQVAVGGLLHVRAHPLQGRGVGVNVGAGRLRENFASEPEVRAADPARGHRLLRQQQRGVHGVSLLGQRVEVAGEVLGLPEHAGVGDCVGFHRRAQCLALGGDEVLGVVDLLAGRGDLLVASRGLVAGDVLGGRAVAAVFLTVGQLFLREAVLFQGVRVGCGGGLDCGAGARSLVEAGVESAEQIRDAGGAVSAPVPREAGSEVGGAATELVAGPRRRRRGEGLVDLGHHALAHVRHRVAQNFLRLADPGVLEQAWIADPADLSAQVRQPRRRAAEQPPCKVCPVAVGAREHLAARVFHLLHEVLARHGVPVLAVQGQ